MTNIPNVGKPAMTALSAVGITELHQLKKIDEKNLLKLHGVGPKSVNILKEALAAQNLGFQESEKLPVSTDFAVFGSLGCNNAPKREVIRDFLINAYAGNEAFDSNISLHDKNISSLEIIRILTHGKEGAAETVAVTTDGELHQAAYFFEFQNHKKDSQIKKITAYTR